MLFRSESLFKCVCVSNSIFFLLHHFIMKKIVRFRRAAYYRTILHLFIVRPGACANVQRLARSLRPTKRADTNFGANLATSHAKRPTAVTDPKMPRPPNLTPNAMDTAKLGTHFAALRAMPQASHAKQPAATTGPRMPPAAAGPRMPRPPNVTPNAMDAATLGTNLATHQTCSY